MGLPLRVWMAALLSLWAATLGGCPRFTRPTIDNGGGVVDDGGDETPDGGGGGSDEGGGAGTGGETPKVVVALPAKTIGLELIGIHDPRSKNYNADCIGCHGDRTNEVALDGVTPAAHSTMLFKSWATGNARCLRCHRDAVDFLSYSAGGLREPVNIERNVGLIGSCTSCHSGDWALGFYVRQTGE